MSSGVMDSDYVAIEDGFGGGDPKASRSDNAAGSRVSRAPACPALRLLIAVNKTSAAPASPGIPRLSQLLEIRRHLHVGAFRLDALLLWYNLSAAVTVSTTLV